MAIANIENEMITIFCIQKRVKLVSHEQPEIASHGIIMILSNVDCCHIIIIIDEIIDTEIVEIFPTTTDR